MKNKLSFRDIADLVVGILFMAFTIWFIISTFGVVKSHAMSTSRYVAMLPIYSGYFVVSTLTRNDKKKSE